MKRYRLPKEFTEKWLKALRSGKYEQGTFKLYKEEDNSYCCLGVAGNICGVSNRSMNHKDIVEPEYFFQINNQKV